MSGLWCRDMCIIHEVCTQSAQEQYAWKFNLMPPNKLGYLQCASFSETRPFTGNDICWSVKSAVVYKLSVATLHHISLSAAATRMYNLSSWFIHGSPTLTRYMLQEQGFGLITCNITLPLTTNCSVYFALHCKFCSITPVSYSQQCKTHKVPWQQNR